MFTVDSAFFGFATEMLKDVFSFKMAEWAK
jgi:hypothetical protein